jgi:heavy metal sensor kinase
MTLTLRTRLALFCTATFAVLLAVVSMASYRVLARQLDLDATTRVTELTTGLHGYLRFAGGKPAIVFDRTDADQVAFVDDATRYYQIYDGKDGHLVDRSEGLEPLGLHVTPNQIRAFLEHPKMYDVQTAFGRFRFSNSSISPTTGQTYLLQVGTSLEPRDNALSRYVDVLLWQVLPSLVVALLAVWWMARVVLTPLSRLADDASSIGIGTLDRRLTLRGTGDQLDEVAAAFNETLARLEGAVNDMRQFSSALAHELRTPLAALRGEIELALLRPPSDPEYRRSLTSQIEEIEKLTRLINQLLTLARAESGEIPLAQHSVDLTTLAAAVTEQLEPVARANDLDLKCVVSQPVTVTGDSGWLERLLLNLLDNAMKFTDKGGSVTVCVSQEGNQARLDVRDTGIGLSAEAIPHIFERFYRSDPARSPAAEGAGLGLSLVKWIIERHEGRIEVESGPAKGSTFTVWLPAALQ